MTRKDLLSFLKVAETGSVTQAAEALGRSQPSVTRCLQDLEATLGFALVERVGRRISLTQEGVAFEEEARRLLAMFDGMPQRVRARVAQAKQPLTISATTALGTGLVPHALARWGLDQRPTEIRLMQAAPNGVAQDLLNGAARVGLSSLPLDVPGLRCLRQFCGPLVVALPECRAKDFPEGMPVSLADVARDRVAMMLDQTRLQGRIMHSLQTAGLEPSHVIKANSTIAALQFTRFLGVPSIVEPITAYGATPRGVILRKLSEEIEFSFGFFLAETAAPSRDIMTFFDVCEAALFDLDPALRRIDAAPDAGK
ncbi:LysR family transcriptional regulator [Thioclava sp. SK-1]|uniref:LysR family transcriptional regulator n=1 Tax=Thioclava sp. SK-1 TaxID=1889770 RepID=UPI00159F0EC1|nr:LysR family transcriptional regulator [Thioclava sp. SK-1]